MTRSYTCIWASALLGSCTERIIQKLQCTCLETSGGGVAAVIWGKPDGGPGSSQPHIRGYVSPPSPLRVLGLGGRKAQRPSPFASSGRHWCQGWKGNAPAPWPVPSWVQKAGPLQTQVGLQIHSECSPGDAVGPPWALMPTSSPTPESLSAQAGLGDSSSSDYGSASLQAVAWAGHSASAHAGCDDPGRLRVVTQTLMSWG